MKTLHNLQIQAIKTIVGRYGEVQAVNDLLKTGWILLEIYTEAFVFDDERKIFSQRPCFVVGRSAPLDQKARPTRKKAVDRPLERIEVNPAEDDLDMETITRLAGKKPGLKHFGEDFDADIPPE